MEAELVIKRPLILTEKGSRLREADNKYLFEVDRRANKIDIRLAVEKLFKVAVVDVNTMNVRGRMRRMGRSRAKTQKCKKANDTHKRGEKIEYYEGT
jgi:large subunit ribosomal protein L23